MKLNIPDRKKNKAVDVYLLEIFRKEALDEGKSELKILSNGVEVYTPFSGADGFYVGIYHHPNREFTNQLEVGLDASYLTFGLNSKATTAEIIQTKRRRDLPREIQSRLKNFKYGVSYSASRVIKGVVSCAREYAHLDAVMEQIILGQEVPLGQREAAEFAAEGLLFKL